jgi:hypothetical protein
MSEHTVGADFPDRGFPNARKPATARQPLAPERAFVVQLRSGPESAPAQMQGRVEHVASGRTLQFGSTAELLDFLLRALTPQP